MVTPANRNSPQGHLTVAKHRKAYIRTWYRTKVLHGASVDLAAYGITTRDIDDMEEFRANISISENDPRTHSTQLSRRSFDPLQNAPGDLVALSKREATGDQEVLEDVSGCYGEVKSNPAERISALNTAGATEGNGKGSSRRVCSRDRELSDTGELVSYPTTSLKELRTITKRRPLFLHHVKLALQSRGVVADLRFNERIKRETGRLWKRLEKRRRSQWKPLLRKLVAGDSSVFSPRAAVGLLLSKEVDQILEESTRISSLEGETQCLSSEHSVTGEHSTPVSWNRIPRTPRTRSPGQNLNSPARERDTNGDAVGGISFLHKPVFVRFPAVLQQESVALVLNSPETRGVRRPRAMKVADACWQAFGDDGFQAAKQVTWHIWMLTFHSKQLAHKASRTPVRLQGVIVRPEVIPKTPPTWFIWTAPFSGLTDSSVADAVVQAFSGRKQEPTLFRQEKGGDGGVRQYVVEFEECPMLLRFYLPLTVHGQTLVARFDCGAADVRCAICARDHDGLCVMRATPVPLVLTRREGGVL